MSVAQLYNTPSDPAALELWSFANADSHEQIIQAIQRQKGVTLTRYILSPISEGNQQGFLVQHQQAHNEIDGVLGGGGNDFTDINPNDPQATEQVFYLHAAEHNRIHNALGI